MAFRALCCVSSPLAHYLMLHIAPRHETSCKLQCAAHCNMWYMFIWDMEQDHQNQPSLLAVWVCHKKDTGNIEPSKWGYEKEAVSADPAALLRKNKLSGLQHTTLKNMKGNNKLFCLIVCYSTCRHTSTRFKMRLSNSALNWVTGVELQDSRVCGNYFFALHLLNCDSAWP